MDTLIYLIRHGETAWNREQRIQGHRDIPLSPAGMQQARQLSIRMKDEQLSAVYSSDLQRAVATAQHIADAYGYEVITTPNLRERNYGALEGLTRQEIDLAYGHMKGGVYPDEAGIESMEDMKARAFRQIEAIATLHQGKRVALVSHGGLINAILHDLTGGKAGTGITRLGNTSITLIRCRTLSPPAFNTRWEVDYMNDCSHVDNIVTFE